MGIRYIGSKARLIAHTVGIERRYFIEANAARIDAVRDAVDRCRRNAGARRASVVQEFLVEIERVR